MRSIGPQTKSFKGDGYRDYRIFTRDYSTQILSVSCFLSPSNIFLIAILVRFRDVRPVSDLSFRNHIYLSLPTETIFNLLRSIPLEYLIGANDSSQMMIFFSEGIYTLEIITRWFQVSVIECNRQTP